MKTVRIVALRQDRKRLLEHLQDSALVQIKRVEKSRSGFERVDMSRPMQVFERNVTLTEQALKILDSVSPEKGGMLASLKGRREVDPDEIGEIAAKSGEVISICKRLAELDKKRSDNSRLCRHLPRAVLRGSSKGSDSGGEPEARIRHRNRSQRGSDDLRRHLRSSEPKDNG